MGLDFTDYNNDGLPDLVITNLANQRYALYAQWGWTLYYDTYVTGLAGMTQLHSGLGASTSGLRQRWAEDLLVAQGHIWIRLS